MVQVKAETRINKKQEILSHVAAVAHVSSTFNNTIITIADVLGNTLCWKSAGASGFKGSKRSTSYAAQTAAEEIGRTATVKGIVSLHVVLRGIGDGRESAIRGLQAAGLRIESISDQTPIPHNGCRAPKRRRV